MYLKKIALKNIGAFEQLTWSLKGKPMGWHVVLGDNGAGKSTFLRAIALGLMGPDQAARVSEDWSSWLSPNARIGRVSLGSASAAGKGSGILEVEIDGTRPFSRPTAGKATTVSADEWSDDPTTFSASFGPFRRFGSLDEARRSGAIAHILATRHLSMFDPNYVFSDALEWLRELHFRHLESGKPEGDLGSKIKHFINQPGLLPHGSRLYEVTSDGVKFIDGNGNLVSAEQLSSGFVAFLALVLELVKICASDDSHPIFSGDGFSITRGGVALIDEIDVHLHPVWQREIGQSLTRLFPNVQFIVSTHSPLVVQAAETGSVMRLPTPGTGGRAEMINGIEFQRIVFGDVLDAYSTGLFGDGVTRSASSRRRLKRLAQLNLKELKDGLSDREAGEVETLRATMPTVSDAGLDPQNQ